MSAQLKKVCHHGISPPVDSCFYCELNLCGRPLRSGRGCKRSVFHKETCFAPWPTTVFEHPWDCHCWECDKKTPPEDGDVPSPSDAAQPVAWRWRRTDMKPGWAAWMYQEIQPTHEILGKVIDIAEVEPLYAHPEDAPEGPTVKGEPCDCCGRFTDPVREEHTSDCQYNVDKLCAEIRGIGDRLEVDRLKGDALNRDVRDRLKGDK